MMRKLFATSLLVLAGVWAASAQQEGIPVVGETIDVRVVNVEVVATDAEGKRVNGLTAGDFRLLVDGQEVPIEYFTEVADGVTAAAAPVAAGPAAPLPPAEVVGRSYLVFVDESFSVAKPRDVVLENLEQELSLLRPQDQMAVLAFDGHRIEVLAPWTSDPAVLAAALRKAREREALGNNALAKHRSMEGDVDFSIWALTEVGFGPEDMVRYLERINSRVSPEARTQLGRTAMALAGSLRGFETPPGRKLMLMLSGGWSMNVAPRLFGPLIAAANQLGYTIYPVDVASPTPRTLKALDGLAAQTGGKVANSVRQDVFRQVVADSSSYYWLGFTPDWQANDRQRAIQIEARRPGLQVRARTGFTDISRQKANAMRAEGALLFGGDERFRRLRVELGEAKRVGSAELEIPITLGVPVESLSLTPVRGGYVAEAPLAISAIDGKGGRAELSSTRLRVQIKEVPAAGGLARFRTSLRVRRADQRLVFTVTDAQSGGSIWQEVDFRL